MISADVKADAVARTGSYIYFVIFYNLNTL